MSLRLQTAGPWSWTRTAAFAAAMAVGSFVAARIAADSFWNAMVVLILWSVAVVVIFGVLNRRSS